MESEASRALGEFLSADELRARVAALEPCAALDLVEGPPFDAPGYDWAYHTHQYVAEASALIEQAAVLLAKLAQANDRTDLARHALAQGLGALPGNEVLYRQRMQLEHDAGTLAGVKAAYEELRAMLADFDSEPTESTQNLLRSAGKSVSHGHEFSKTTQPIN